MQTVIRLIPIYLNFRVTGLLSFGPKNETAIRQMVDALEKLKGAKYVFLCFWKYTHIY